MACAVATSDIERLLRIQRASFATASPNLLDSWPEANAMNVEALQSFLEPTRYAMLATTRPDRRPLATPIAFLVRHGSFWLALTEGVHSRNLQSLPYASLVLMRGEGSDHKALMTEGWVTLHEMSEGIARQWTRRQGSPPTWASVAAEVRPERLLTYAA
jgi:hypothetical protein